MSKFLRWNYKNRQKRFVKIKVKENDFFCLHFLRPCLDKLVQPAKTKKEMAEQFNLELVYSICSPASVQNSNRNLNLSPFIEERQVSKLGKQNAPTSKPPAKQLKQFMFKYWKEGLLG